MFEEELKKSFRWNRCSEIWSAYCYKNLRNILPWDLWCSLSWMQFSVAWALSWISSPQVSRRAGKKMPAAFYTIFHLRHLHIQGYDRLVPEMPALLLLCPAINDSCNKKGCSIKTWWYKCFAVCFSGLPVHFAVLWLLTPFHTICSVSLAPRAKQAHAGLALATFHQPLCLLSNFGTCWPIFLLLMLLFANTTNIIFSSFLPKDVYWE